MFVAFSTVNSLGATFMEWSFHYLTGKDTYWSINHGTIPLVMDPTNELNAHAHEKNHPKDLNEVKEFVANANLNQKKSSDILSCYPQVDGITIGGRTLDQNTKIIEYLKHEGFKIFTINLTRPYPYLTERSGSNQIESLFKLCQTLSKGRINIDPTDVKILRETISLRILKNKKDWLENLKSFYEKINPMVDQHFTDHEWWTHTEKCMIKLIRSAGLDLDERRHQSWLPIMKKWQAPLHDMIHLYDFVIPLIVNHIIEDKMLDLRPFKLEMIHQALIMAHLMKDHGRRLVLSSSDFPNNTKTAYRLLK